MNDYIEDFVEDESAASSDLFFSFYKRSKKRMPR